MIENVRIDWILDNLINLILPSKRWILQGKGEIEMLDFIDTDLFDKDRSIKVIVFSNYSYRAKEKALSLIDGEKIVNIKENGSGLTATVRKNGLEISIITAPLGESARGHRTNYALVDRNIFSMDNASEIFYNIVYPIAVSYGLSLVDENRKPSANIMLF